MADAAIILQLLLGDRKGVIEDGIGVGGGLLVAVV